MTDAVVTKAGTEVWAVGTPAARVTKIGHETWFSIVPAVVVTTAAREVWFPQPEAGTGGRRRRVMVIT